MMRIVLLLIVCALFLAGYMLLSAAADPVVRRFHYAPGRPLASGRPIRLVLMTDTHVAGPDTPPARLSRVVAQVNALKPDLVLLAGDYVSGKWTATRRYTAAEAILPLAGLKPPMGVLAVLGNHDHWDDAGAARRSLAAAGITVLDNAAVRKGDLVIGGVDDAVTGYDKVAVTAARMRALGGIPILLTHTPDVFPMVPKDVGLVLAGHTHCGQIIIPFLGPLASGSGYGRRFLCGVVHEGGRWLIVSAGVGTSVLPMRLGAPPDIWLIEIG